jgi:HEAT repeat protein
MAMLLRRRYTIAPPLLVLLLMWAGWAQQPEESRTSLLVTERTKQLLVASLSEDDPSLRSRSLDVLARLADPSSADAIRALAKSPEASLRADALAALEKVLPPAELSVALRVACDDTSDRVARRAYAALARTPGAEAYGALLEVGEVVSGERFVWWARAVAARPEQPSTDLLEKLLGDEDPRTRAAGARALRRAAGALPVARRLELLSDTDALVRSVAAHGLEPVASEQQPRAALVRSLGDPSPLVRRAALETLRNAPPALEHVAPLLEDPDSTVRRAAVDAVGAIGTEDTTAPLIARLADPELLVARLAGERLAERGGEPVAAALEATLGDTNEQVVAEAARALGQMRHTASLQRLIGLADHRAPVVRAAVYEALGRLGDASAVPVLIARGEDEKGRARVELNVALGRLGDAQAVPHLLVDIHYPDYPSMGIDPANFTGANAPYPPPYPAEDTAVAAAAVRALGQIGDARAVDEVSRLAYDVLRNAEFWDNVARTLEQLGDPKAAPALEQLGIVGAIAQNTRQIDLPDSTRIAALHAIAHLQLRELEPRILAIDPQRCPVPVRRAAAEVLTELTGREYAYREPSRTVELFFMDLGKLEDASALKLPICYAVQQP